MKIIKDFIEKHHNVTKLEVNDKKKKPFTFIGSMIKRKGLKMWEFNPDNMGIRQIVEVPVDVKFLENRKFFNISYKKIIHTEIHDRFKYKGGMCYIQAVNSKTVEKKVGQYLQSVMTKYEDSSKK